MILSITDLDKELLKQTVDSLKNEKNKLLCRYYRKQIELQEVLQWSCENCFLKSIAVGRRIERGINDTLIF